MSATPTSNRQPGVRRLITPEERDKIWKLRKSGASLAGIGRIVGRLTPVIRNVLATTGGYQPRERVRRADQLTLEEREEISRGLSAGRSLRSVAQSLGRSASTVSREVARNGGRSKYRAAGADARAVEAAERPKPCKLSQNVRLKRVVVAKLKRNWSPQQISGWLGRKYHREPSMKVSHETIYRTLFVQARGVLKKELLAHLRRGRTMRSSRTATKTGQGRGQIVDAISIRERPAEVEDRAVPGHWEGDLIEGRGSYIATLVERTSRCLLLVKVNSKGAVEVSRALAEQVRHLPKELRRSLTWDRGSEMANHKEFTLATDVQVYFCDPRSPWQRGSNENTNGLLRQYFPKGTYLGGYSQTELNRIARQLNERPRLTLGYKTPAEVFQESVALTD